MTRRSAAVRAHRQTGVTPRHPDAGDHVESAAHAAGRPGTSSRLGSSSVAVSNTGRVLDGDAARATPLARSSSLHAPFASDGQFGVPTSPSRERRSRHGWSDAAASLAPVARWREQASAVARSRPDMPRTWRPLLVFTGVACGGAGAGGAHPPAQLVHEAYVWQRAWTGAVRDAVSAAPAELTGLRVLALEVDGDDETWPAVDVAALAATGRPVTAVVRHGGARPRAELSLAALLARLGVWQRAGVDVIGVEIDPFPGVPERSAKRSRRGHSGSITSLHVIGSARPFPVSLSRRRRRRVEGQSSGLTTSLHVIESARPFPVSLSRRRRRRVEGPRAERQGAARRSDGLPFDGGLARARLAQGHRGSCAGSCGRQGAAVDRADPRLSPPEGMLVRGPEAMSDLVTHVQDALEDERLTAANRYGRAQRAPR